MMLCLMQSCKHHSKPTLQADKGQLTLQLSKGQPCLELVIGLPCLQLPKGQPCLQMPKGQHRPSLQLSKCQGKPTLWIWIWIRIWIFIHTRLSQSSSRPRASQSTSHPRCRWGMAIYRLWRTVWQQLTRRRMDHVHFLPQTGTQGMHSNATYGICMPQLWILWWLRSDFIQHHSYSYRNIRMRFIFVDVGWL